MMYSIIVPIYNVEEYIEKCICSILSQNFKDFELILIDDGSTDNSYNICNSYAQKHKNIVLCNKQNGGVSSARNYGLNLAKGEYVIFIDSDDFISPDYFEKLQASITPTTDYLFSGLIYCYHFEEVSSVKLVDRKWNLLSEDEFLHFLRQPLQTSPCAKVYRNQIIQKNHLRFDESISFGEDRDFNTRYFNHIVNATSLSYIGYYYRTDVPNSLSKQFHQTKFYNSYINWEMKNEMLKQRLFFSDEANQFITNDLYHIICDEIADISSQYSSPFTALKTCSKEMSFVDWDFLKQRSSLIKAPKWQKRLLLNKFYLVLFLIYKMNSHGKAKG